MKAQRSFHGSRSGNFHGASQHVELPWNLFDFRGSRMAAAIHNYLHFYGTWITVALGYSASIKVSNNLYESWVTLLP